QTYIFKLVSSSGVTESGESEKVLLLMESGIRLHTTVYTRDKSNTPSGFTLKLRKHIRTRRLEDVRQLGYDRIIIFQFGLGVNTHYVILELYAQGNILLTDADFTVLTLLRSHRDDNKGLAIMSRHRYPVENSRAFERTSREKIFRAIESFVEGSREEQPENDSEAPDGSTVVSGNNNATVPNELKKTNVSRGKQATLKTVLGDALSYGPALSEHIILDAGLKPGTKIDVSFELDDNISEVLARAVMRFEDWLADVIYGDKIPNGYILMQQKVSGKKNNAAYDIGTTVQIYDEFCPLLLNQFKSRDCIEFETFDAVLDEFYSKIESQRVEQQQKTKENSAMQKLEKIKLDQESRVHALKREVEHSVKTAELIEYNLEDVDSAILAVRVALANGMSWVDLDRMVKEEKKSGNPVASLIDKLHLEKNCITLLLSNNLDEMDDDERTQPVDKVEVDLALSAHANARRYYEMKKRQESKQEKTMTAHEKAFKAAERKTRQQLSQEKTVAQISHIRKVHWFEKFNWFISSENYLVISGRDAQQNEMIVKRYMSKGDLYVHADLHGASSTIIKNHKPECPIPPLTLNQTGCFTVCHSQAWDSKIVTSAWWVYSHQVSKTAPTGEYLTVGSFMIRGRKNFLPPQPLVMGFGVLFRLDESSLGSHLNERRVRGEEEGIDNAEQGETFEEISYSGSDSEKDHLEFPEAPENSSETSVNNDSSTLPSAVRTNLDELIDRALEIGSSTASSKQSPGVVEENHHPEVKKEIQRDKPHISKAERRKLKKVGKDDDDDDDVVEHEQVKGETHHSEVQPDNAAKLSKPISRGQRGKLKKIKEKYADQDEEERSIKMALLAADGKSKKNVKKHDSKKSHEETEAKPPTASADVTKVCYKCKKPGHTSKDCPEHPLANDEEEEDDVHEIGEEEKEKLNDVDYLTGNPLLNDVLLYALPVCGPYNALQSYKYRVKIIPGSLKKGK
ncbi:hypothetical protein M569_15323, partial [Genlisea aurea]